MPTKILICGLPGTGKSTTAMALYKALRASGRTVHWLDGDAIRDQYPGLGFSRLDRVTQAKRMADLAAGRPEEFVVASFIAPTPEARLEFGADLVAWMDGAGTGAFPDTQAMWQPPTGDYVRLPEDAQADVASDLLVGVMIGRGLLRLKTDTYLWDHHAPTALLVGRFQPPHQGHRALALAALQRCPQVSFGVRLMARSPSNPLGFDEVHQRLRSLMAPEWARCQVLCLPNIGGIYWGREVGYDTGRLVLPAEIEAMSATAIRARGPL